MLVSYSFSFSALRDFHCVERLAVLCWLSCAASSFRCFCASSWRSRSVLKKSASVVAKDSALMVTAVEDRLAFCGILAFLIVKRTSPLLDVRVLE